MTPEDLHVTHRILYSSGTGFFIIKAAVLSSAKQVKGLDAVFRSVASFSDGAWLLALLACGLFCYGLYCLLEARYRDLTPEQ